MELIKWEKIASEIEVAKDWDEILPIKDKVAVFKAWAKQTKQSLPTRNKIAEYELRIERKMGGWLNINVPHGGARKSSGDDSHLKLDDLGINQYESKTSRQIALIPIELFEQEISEKKIVGELTTAGMLRLSQEGKKQQRKEDIINQAERIEAGELPELSGLYHVISIDPPWPYGRSYDPLSSRVANPYPEMSLEDIKNIELPAMEDSVLWLWTTHKFLPEAFNILNHWGFDYKATLVWNKEKLGMGVWLRMQCEFCLLAIKGNPVIENTTERDIIIESRREHSRKPEKFYELVNKICFGRKLEYFAREAKEGWDCFGNEVNKFNAVAG